MRVISEAPKRWQNQPVMDDSMAGVLIGMLAGAMFGLMVWIGVM